MTTRMAIIEMLKLAFYLRVWLFGDPVPKSKRRRRGRGVELREGRL